MNVWRWTPGYLSILEGLKLQELAKNKIVLEIGAFKGKSTVCMAETASHVYTIDPFNAMEDGQTIALSITTFNIFLRNIAPFNHKITYFIGYSYDIIPKMDISVHFIFVDGAHDYLNVNRDISLLSRFFMPGTIIAFHDYYENKFPGVKKAVDEVFTEPQGSVGSLIWFKI